MGSAYDAFLAYHRETAVFSSFRSLLSWDQDTYMPKGGAELRSRQVAALSGFLHERQTGDAYRTLLEAAEEENTAQGDSFEAANLRLARRDFDRAVKLPGDLVRELTRVTSLARRAWAEARDRDDFAAFLPWLEQVLDLTRRSAAILAEGDQAPYDALLDQYDRGLTTAQVRALFGPLRESLTALLDRILGSRAVISDAPLRGDFPVGIQARLAREGAAALGFDFDRGRLDVTPHPFCATVGPGDVRLTTNYKPDDFGPAFFSVLHEAGHGMYEQGLPEERWGEPAGRACSMGVHESQSRMWENLVGRSRAFWRWYFPRVREAFPAALRDTREEDFWRATNVVKRSLIRTDADEVTYNLHILLRFELEAALLEGDLAPKDLPAAWREKSRALLGIEAGNDRDGCLQDIHWSMGGFGYFPTYTLGNLYAAQIFVAAEREAGPFDDAFSRGDFAPLLGWLRGKVHAHGSRWEPAELVERASGAPPSADALVAHLESRFPALYS